MAHRVLEVSKLNGPERELSLIAGAFARPIEQWPSVMELDVAP
jgi:hypothetical protein